MKNKVLRSLVKVLTVAAFVCASTSSLCNCYEPEKPESLR